MILYKTILNTKYTHKQSVKVSENVYMRKTTGILLPPLILRDSSTEMPYKILSIQLINYAFPVQKLQNFGLSGNS